jgi:organic radical activating enzyme
MKLLSLDLTHRCNLRCSFCWKFMDRARLGDMTSEQLDNFCKYLHHIPTPYLRIVGGEPLMHKNFKGAIARLRQTFGDMKFLIVTNGTRLTDELIRMPNMEYVITSYPQNENISRQFSGKITITRRKYFDRNHDPNLTEERARSIHKRCGYKQYRVIGDYLYDCCHAETLHRLERSPFTGVKVAPDCDKELLAKEDNWRECIHCFVGDGGRLI